MAKAFHEDDEAPRKNFCTPSSCQAIDLTTQNDGTERQEQIAGLWHV